MKDIGHTNVKEKDFKDTLLFIVTFSVANGHTEVAVNDSNDTPACDDNCSQICSVLAETFCDGYWSYLFEIL